MCGSGIIGIIVFREFFVLVSDVVVNKERDCLEHGNLGQLTLNFETMKILFLIALAGFLIEFARYNNLFHRTKKRIQ